MFTELRVTLFYHTSPISPKSGLQTLHCQSLWPSAPPHSKPYPSLQGHQSPQACSPPMWQCEWQTSSVWHPDPTILGILCALGKSPAHPQALAVSKLCRFLNEHSCLPYAPDQNGKARSASIAWTNRQDTWAIASKIALQKRNNTKTFLGCKRLGLQSLLWCLFRDFMLTSNRIV